MKLNLAPVEEKQGYFFLLGCRLFDHTGQRLTDFFGDFCQLTPSGDLVTRTGPQHMAYKNKEVSYISANGNTVWSHNLNVHHEVHWSDEMELITVVGSENHEDENGKEVRYDTLAVMNRSGEKLGFVDLFSIKKNIFSRFNSTLQVEYFEKRNFFEVFHVNSAIPVPKKFYHLYSVPKKALAVAFTLPRLGGVAIVDLKSQNLLWHHVVNNSVMVHQISFTPEGRLLVFVNDWLKNPSRKEMDFYKVSESNRSKCSSVVEITSTKAQRTVFDGCGSSLKMFSQFRGGVQRISENHFLVTLHDGWVVETKNNTIAGIWPFDFDDYPGIYRSQLIPSELAKKFLSNTSLQCQAQDYKNRPDFCYK